MPPSPCSQDKKCDWREVKDSQAKHQENCVSISISKSLQEQHCHIWYRHSCCWMTSRSLPALFLFFHHQSFDLKLFSYNWVPTQNLKTSQNPTEEGLPIFSEQKYPALPPHLPCSGSANGPAAFCLWQGTQCGMPAHETTQWQLLLLLIRVRCASYTESPINHSFNLVIRYFGL